jgi:hypothetical protein
MKDVNNIECFCLYFIKYDVRREKNRERERERQNVPNYTKEHEITGRTNERICCLDRLHSDDKSNRLFIFFKKRVRKKKEKSLLKKWHSYNDCSVLCFE